MPADVSLGEIKEVTLIIDEDPEKPENVFFEPMPLRMVASGGEDEEEEEGGTYMATMGAFN